MQLQFNDTSADKNGLIQTCETKLFGSNYGAISGNTKRLATFTRYINAGLNRYTSLAVEHDTRWQFHDSNYTTEPEAYTTMAEGQSDYGLSEVHLQLRHVYVKNSDGVKIPIQPVDEYDTARYGVAIDEYFVGNGFPAFYDKRGRSIRLFPAPDASQVQLSQGLHVTYLSTPSYFDRTDTTKKPGIPLTFAEYPAIYACWKYTHDNVMQKKAKAYQEEVQLMEQEIVTLFTNRDRDDKPQMRVRKKRYI